MRAPQLHVEPVVCNRNRLNELVAAHPKRYPVLLDSAAEGPLSQWSLLAALPQAQLTLSARGELKLDGHPFEHSAADNQFLTTLDRLWREGREHQATRPYNIPFGGGWLAYLGYELALEIEPKLAKFWPPASLEDPRPVAFALRIPAAVLSHIDGRAYLVAEPSVSAEQLQMIRDDLAAHFEDIAEIKDGDAPEPLTVSDLQEEVPEAYLTRVSRAKDYIRAGDIYQANLSRVWKARLTHPAAIGAVYAKLRRSNPAPFAALARVGDFALLSSSPERLLRIRGKRADTRPIAGTHPRGRTAADDADLKAALIAHPKERAEHVMLIDLARNDLGRVCQGGSVRVDEYMAIETYAHVHHIVSNITGELREGVSPIDALRAVFPGGTITGVPKVRCMQIISELEQAPRGPYTGSLGFINHDGSADFNILIRTLSLWQEQLEIRAGAGIVADSDPQRELAETRTKAQGMLLALQT